MKFYNDLRPIIWFNYLTKLLLLLSLVQFVFCVVDVLEVAEDTQIDEEKKEDDLVKVGPSPKPKPLLPPGIYRGHRILYGEGVAPSDFEMLTVDPNAPVQSDGTYFLNTTGLEGNVTVANVTGSENRTSIKVECLLSELADDEIPSVVLMNGTSLMKLFSVPANNSTAGECTIVMFYSPYCIFCARAAPHFNALARVFPGVKCYAVDAMSNGNLHLRYGLVAVPNVMFFHKGKPIARFNETHLNLEKLVTFIEKYTGLSYNGTLNVTSADMSGPVPSTLSRKVDYVLIFAWLFTLTCMCYGFSKSSVCNRIVESVKRTWQEAEAQHEHED